MPTKIETTLSPEKLHEFFQKAASTPGGATGPVLQKLAAEYGVTISHNSANELRKGAFAQYLEELKAARALAENVTALAAAGTDMGDAAAAAFGAKVLDAALKIEAEDIGGKAANNLSLAIARLRTGDQRAAYLEAKIDDMEKRLALQQFDAAKAALEHVKELRDIAGNASLGTAEKLEAARLRLFGTAPEGTPTLKDLDSRRANA